MIPITINGLGLRESLYLLVFGELGTQDEMAVALGLLQFVIVMIVALPGGPIYSLYKAEGRVPEQATTGMIALAALAPFQVPGSTLRSHESGRGLGPRPPGVMVKIPGRRPKAPPTFREEQGQSRKLQRQERQ